MLKALNLRQYRGFESYQLADLARVNLLVGGNNAGKTSILEAVELLLSGGSPSALIESAVCIPGEDIPIVVEQDIEVR